MSTRPIANVSARFFSAALMCISREETRYYIGGVHIEPHPEKGALLVSTDGHRMLVLHDVDGKCRKPVIVPAEKILRAVLDRPKDGDRLIIGSDGIVEVPGRYRAEKNTLIDGTYPAWESLVNEVRVRIGRKEKGFATFNAGYVGAFDKVGERLGIAKNGIRAVRFVTPGDSGTATLVLFPQFGNAFGVLMPMRLDVPGGGDGIPIWMKPVLERKPAKPAALPTKKRRAA